MDVLNKDIFTHLKDTQHPFQETLSEVVLTFISFHAAKIILINVAV